MRPAPASFTSFVIVLASAACGLAVGSVYASQISVDAIAADLGIDQAMAGAMLASTQVGYACGLTLIVPLGDIINRRALLLAKLTMLTLSLLATAIARNATTLFVGMFLIGLMAVVTQSLVAYAAARSSSNDRGRVVGYLTTGVVAGIVSTRIASGYLTDLYGWRSTYFGLFTLAAAVTMALVKFLPTDDQTATHVNYRSLLASLWHLYKDESELRMRAWIAATSFAAFSALWTTLVFMVITPPHSLSHTQAGYFGLVGISGALAARLAGSFADRGWGNKAVSLALQGLCLAWPLIAAGQSSLWLLVFGAITMDVAIQTIHVNSQIALYGLRSSTNGRVVAVYMSFYSLGSCAGALASVWLYSHSGWPGVAMLGMCLSLTSLALWRRLQRALGTGRQSNPAINLL